MTLLPLLPGTCVYVPTFETLGELEAWALEKGLDLVSAERGPDGLIRGVARQPDSEVRT